MRQPIIAGNWKMHKTVRETVGAITDLRGTLREARDVTVVVAPPFTAVQAAAQAAHGSQIGIAGQNCHAEREGAFTGEVSAPMLREAGAQYVIVGHSERRTLFLETDADVNRKIVAALAAGLVPIVCIGETLEQRELNQTTQVLSEQLSKGLDGLTAEHLSRMALAYEPVWAIGTGRTASPTQAQEAHAHIRSRVRQWFGADAAAALRVLYGGSVKPDNVATLIAQVDVDGALVGGASLDVRAFTEMVLTVAS